MVTKFMSASTLLSAFVFKPANFWQALQAQLHRLPPSAYKLHFTVSCALKHRWIRLKKSVRSFHSTVYLQDPLPPTKGQQPLDRAQRPWQRKRWIHHPWPWPSHHRLHLGSTAHELSNCLIEVFIGSQCSIV